MPGSGTSSRRRPSPSPSFEEDPNQSEVEYSEESGLRSPHTGSLDVALHVANVGAFTSSEEVDLETSASEDSESLVEEGDGRPPPCNSSDKALQSDLLAYSDNGEKYSESFQSKSSSEVDGPRGGLLFLELSEKTEKGKGKKVMESRTRKKRKSEQAKDVPANPYKYLTILIEIMDDRLKDAGKRPWLKDRMMDLDPEVLIDLERKCLVYWVNEIKVLRSRHEFHLEVLKAIREEEMPFNPSGLYSHPPHAEEANSDVSSTVHQVQPTGNGNHKNDSGEEQHSNLNCASSSNLKSLWP